MRWEIAHRTQYRYAAPVKDSFNQVRLHPHNSETQSIERFALNIQPLTHCQQFQDFYGNTVHQFEIADLHESLSIETQLTAVTRAPTAPLADAIVFPIDKLREATGTLQCYEFLQPSRFVDVDSLTHSVALEATQGLADVWQAAQAIGSFVRGHLAYVAHATSVHTHMREVLARRQGVCQDFAHVALGMCRSIHLPAIYVSGYLAADNANATHAWIEVFVPGSGWHGLDPTHDRMVDQRYLKVCIGRDYDDVAPVTGRYRGTLQREMEVTVRIETSPCQQQLTGIK